jgi:phosphohistidine phosphatase
VRERRTGEPKECSYSGTTLDELAPSGHAELPFEPRPMGPHSARVRAVLHPSWKVHPLFMEGSKVTHRQDHRFRMDSRRCSRDAERRKRENPGVKTLFLMRHAKSSWDDPDLADQERPLNPRGRKAAARMADYMKRAGIEPAIVLSTSAVRARQTVELLRPVFPNDTQFKFEPRLYTAGSDQLLARIRRLSPSADSVLVVGHHPAMQDLVLGLASKGSGLKAIRAKFPTAALAVLEAKADAWREIEHGKAKLVDYVTPKGLRNG